MLRAAQAATENIHEEKEAEVGGIKFSTRPGVNRKIGESLFPTKHLST